MFRIETRDQLWSYGCGGGAAAATFEVLAVAGCYEGGIYILEITFTTPK